MADDHGPGFPKSDAELARDRAELENEELRKRLADATPVKRVGGRRDLGSAVVFLVSPEAAFVTGQNIPVDGGWSIW